MPLAVVSLVAVGMSVVVGLITGAGWVGYLLGAVWAMTVWVILFCGSLAGPKDRSLADRVPAWTYAIAAAFAVLMGGVAFWLTDTTAFWSVGVIMAGLLTPAMNNVCRDPAPS